MEERREDRNLFAASAKFLAEHYATLGDIRSDFRNSSLNHLLGNEVNAVKGSRVVDVGCGSGFLLRLLAETGKSVVGIEPNDAEIELARRYNPGVRILKGFAEDIDTLLASRVDSIVMADVLEHIEDDRGQVQKFYDHLDKGGRLILVVPAYGFLYGKRDERMGHYRRYSRAELVALVTAAGFRITSVRYWNMLGFLPYLFSEKILKKELRTDLRSAGPVRFPKRVLRKLLQVWFESVENRVDFGFGLSLVCVAEKP